MAAPAAGYVGTLIAVLMLGLGVIALRDSAVSAGWLDGRPWITTVINWIDGLTFAWWMIPAGIAAILVGAWWVYAALRPRRRTALAVTAASSVWIAPCRSGPPRFPRRRNGARSPRRTSRRQRCAKSPSPHTPPPRVAPPR